MKGALALQMVLLVVEQCRKIHKIEPTHAPLRKKRHRQQEYSLHQFKERRHIGSWSRESPPPI
eukprot:scaffold305772_cov22-Tisochrysis_lutea.AAC.1